jgi:hypothetical protein
MEAILCSSRMGRRSTGADVQKDVSWILGTLVQIRFEEPIPSWGQRIVGTSDGNNGECVALTGDDLQERK